MRPIKFRGKALSDGRWVYGYYRFISESNTHQIIWGEQLQAGADIDPNTLGQLTGLLDKNGKEIYESDVVKFGDAGYGIVNGEIKFDRCGFCIFYKAELSDVFLSLTSYEVEVIGNIYENLELLTKNLGA